MKHSEYQKLLKTDKNNAHQTLYNEYLNYVYTIAFNRLRSCGSREDIDECVIDIFTDIFNSYEYRCNENDDIKGFIATVAIRKSAAYYHKLCRDSKNISLDDECNGPVASTEDISEAAEKSETRRILLKLIDDLGEPDSTIIIQKYYYGRSSREISGFVSLTPAMVRVRNSRALKKLRVLLSDHGILI